MVENEQRLLTATEHVVRELAAASSTSSSGIVGGTTSQRFAAAFAR